MKFPDVRRVLLLCVVVAVAFIFMRESWERFRAYARYIQVQELKENWYEGGGIPHDRKLNEGFKLGYIASEYDKASPEYRYMLAGLHAWREKGLRLWPEQAKAESQKIIENLKAALVRRPTWYEAWILLALVKFQLGEFDHELEIVLEKAIETGRYETVVQHGVSMIALGLWDKLGPGLRDNAKETLSIALGNTSVNKFVVERIVMSGRVDEFREILQTDEKLWSLTERYLEKRKEAL